MSTPEATDASPLASARPSIDVAVVMRRERIDNRWQPWRWVLYEVLPPSPHHGEGARLLLKDDREERWLHAPFVVELFRDDAEGYYLNGTTPAPCWFVLWRMDEPESVPEGQALMARPVAVSLSYHDAGRWLDAQETVEQVPAPQEVIDWMMDFVARHYVIEPKRRKRPESFRTLTDRFGNPASVTTEKKRGGGEHG
jgi:hypothetical protein